MSTPITYPNLIQNASYCTVQDVLNLIGNIAPIQNGTIGTTQINSAITAAEKYINSACHRTFSPKRVIQRYDGNGQSTMVTGFPDLIVVNQLSVYMSYPIAIARTAQDHDLIFDGNGRKAGTIEFPTYSITPSVLPYSYIFYPASKNVIVDAWYAPTNYAYGETLTTTDNTTYKFANQTMVTQSTTAAYTFVGQQPPQYFPLVYKNGTLLTNTTYVIASTGSQSGLPTNEWQIQQDNIYYTINYTLQGGQSITFNTPNQSTDVITADYVYWSIPDDIREASAKKAAITILTSASTATFASQQFQGAVEIVDDGARIQYQGGQWGPQINWWDTEISNIIKSNFWYQMPWGTGNLRNWGGIGGGW